MSKQAIAVAAGPSFGPAVVTLFGIDVPVVAMTLSLVALILARQIARPSLRRLSKRQEFYLTVVLVIILFLVVTGQLFGEPPVPLGPGWAVVWAIGLGMSGILILEIFADYILGFIRTFFEAIRNAAAGRGAGGAPPNPPPTDEPPAE